MHQEDDNMVSLSKRLFLHFLIILAITSFHSSETRSLKSRSISEAALVNAYISSLTGTPTISRTPPSIEKVNLYVRTSGTYVRITNAGVDASSRTTTTDPDSFVIILSKYKQGRVTIKGKKSGKYVCFHKNSTLIVEPTFVPGCLFIEKKNRKKWTIFESVRNNTWFVAFSNKKKSFGKSKAGKRTARGDRSIMFVKITP